MKRAILLTLLLVACDGEGTGDGGLGGDAAPAPDLVFTVATFNVGTTLGLAHDGPPDDGYTMEMATISDEHYGNGLAWLPAVGAVRTWIANEQPDIIVFQEIFHPEGCAAIPAGARAGFYCEGYEDGDLAVVEQVLGPTYQIACNLERPDKCAAVRVAFGRFAGCGRPLCLDGLDGARVPDCGGGSRVGRGVIELTDGGTITLAHIHGTSGITAEEQGCRTAQFEQIFVDLDGAPAANGDANLVMGDFNTDPVRLASGDTSAMRLAELVDENGFAFVTATDRRSDPTYAGLFSIDHVISDTFTGSCRAFGITEGTEPPIDAVYFDHVPILCEVGGDLP